jgi:carbon storage regulator CsrA
MLVISRKVGEAFRIGTEITVCVREVHGKHVKLVISAPPSVGIARSELDGPEDADPDETRQR